MQKNGYTENFLNRCFKLFLSRIHIIKEKSPTVEKKPLRLALPYLGTKYWKLGLNCKSPTNGVNYRLFLNAKINSVIIFALKTLFLHSLHQVWFISFSVDCAMNPIADNALDILL